jgi:Domain of unknown function (DUF4383)
MDGIHAKPPNVRRTPAQLYCLVLGVAFLAAGVLGFFYSSDFVTGEAAAEPDNRAAVLGLLDVNGWHNLVHVTTGALALKVAGSYSAARAFAIVFGALYLAITLLGLIAGDGGVVLGLLPVNTADNVLHAVVGLSGLLLGLASRSEPDPTTV